jgi:flagellar biogenesis protein FliO
VTLSLIAAMLGLAFASPAAAQLTKTKQSATTQPVTVTEGTSSTLRIATSLGAVIALIFVLRWGAKFLNVKTLGKSEAISVLGRCGIGPRQQLVLVHVGKRVVLIGNGGGQMNTLCEIDDEQEVAQLVSGASEKTEKTAFASVFKKEQEKFDIEEEPEPQIGLARQELRDLMSKVKGLSKGFGS